MSTTKRQRVNTHGAYHDHVVLEDDFEIIHSRQTSLIGHGRLPTESNRSPQKRRTHWTVGSAWAPEDDPELSLDPSGEWYDEVVEAPITETRVYKAAPPKKKKSKVSRRPHLVWKENHRSTYLDEMLRWEGRGEFSTATECSDCLARKITDNLGKPEFRCIDCFLPDMVCRECCLRRHRRQPLHLIERWTGTHFLRISLKAIGLRVQLNHISMRCSNPEPCHAKFQILHVNGIHSVAVDYCGCERKLPKHIQLLRRGLYPASQITVKTCATFPLLSHLHLLALTSKGTTYDFYRTLEKATNNTGVNVPKSRYRALLRMSLQWRHLKLLKRGGRAHDVTGVEGTADGELAILCPSCPHPGINLPEGWMDSPEEIKFLYALILCMDANFRLKNQLVSSYSRDPGLGIGWAYMVRREPYEKYVLSRADDRDISTCVGFQALAKATTKFSKGLRYTGVGAVTCARGEMILPKGVGNLQKGERYANMDYIFASAIQSTYILLIIISYDIACQWFVKLFWRMTEFWPDDLKIKSGIKTIPRIPKFHEPGHTDKNHEQFSCNFGLGMGMTDCECPERVWAPHGVLGNSTKTQGPGSRHDVLDDNFGFWNWLKYISHGTMLMRKYKAGIADRNQQTEGHRGFTNTLPEKLVQKWEEMCAVWDKDEYPKTAKSPFKTDGICLSEAQVRKELADEEEGRLAGGGVALNVTSASSFLILALELEESQRRLQKLVRSHSKNSTMRQDTSVTEQRNVLRTKLRSWEQLRSVYMPGLLQLQSDLEAKSSTANVNSSSNPEDSDLWLPSQLPQGRRNAVCIPNLPEVENRLRTAQCYDALDGLRHVLRIKTRMVQFKNKNIRGQREGTRSRAVIDRIHLRAQAFVEKYRVAREAKLKLCGSGEWETSLRPLLDTDVRSYTDPSRKQPGRRKVIPEDEDEDAAEAGDEGGTEEMTTTAEAGINLLNDIRKRKDGTGQTRRTLSWIWLTAPPQLKDQDVNQDEDDIL